MEECLFHANLAHRGQPQQKRLDRTLKIEAIVQLLHRGIIGETIEEAEGAKASFHPVG
ncbi:hypothetical protein [Pontibacter ruber]|uniref:Uncharacterized protein n=1 Tax=Pontibacter ruber TaxID=1343895 RepID=A0ABW5D0L3_9BACT|nr:hypothetical protein [Pontibacter ruber]